MKKALELAFATGKARPIAWTLGGRRGLLGGTRLATYEASSLAWMLLAGELAAALFLFASGKFPSVLIRGLALLLRF